MEAMGHTSWLSTMVAQRGHALYELDLLDDAVAAAERGRELGADDDLATATNWRRVEAKVLASRGDGEQAEPLARQALELIEATDMLDAQADAWLDLGIVLELLGRPDEAGQALDEAAARYERKENLLMLGRVRERQATLA
jgi:tetratricopeptide (TPR) repeat protein